jgi:hypothetical protein
MKSATVAEPKLFHQLNNPVIALLHSDHNARHYGWYDSHPSSQAICTRDTLNSSSIHHSHQDSLLYT